jgi:hypothetical protein
MTPSALKPHCIQSSQVLVPAGTSKSRHIISDAVTLSSTMRTGGFELGLSALTSSTLKWLHRIQCGFKSAYVDHKTCKAFRNIAQQYFQDILRWRQVTCGVLNIFQIF